MTPTPKTLRFENELAQLIGLRDGDTSELIKTVLKRRADAKDTELQNQLLRQLIVNYSDSQQELISLNRKLVARQKQLDDDLLAAARIQKSFLPNAFTRKGEFQFSWKFKPCDRIGGDIFNLFMLDENHIGLYMMDVSGHGVPAALMTISVSQNLQPQSSDYTKRIIDRPPFYEIISPGIVLGRLNQDYPFERFDKFISIFYAVLNIRDGKMTYSNAGHPPPVLLRNSGDSEVLEKGGSIIGPDPNMSFEEDKKQLHVGEKLILYTDGITEYRSLSNDFFGTRGLHAVLAEHAKRPIEEILDRIFEALILFGGNETPKDDISMLGIEHIKADSP